jgi:hypothetical protein
MHEVNNEGNATMDREKDNMSKNGEVVSGSRCKLPIK